VANIYHAWPDADVNQLIEADYLDPISGFPGFKSLLCEVTKIQDFVKNPVHPSIPQGERSV
jgi:hypothetical protein